VVLIIAATKVLLTKNPQLIEDHRISDHVDLGEYPSFSVVLTGTDAPVGIVQPLQANTEFSSRSQRAPYIGKLA